MRCYRVEMAQRPVLRQRKSNDGASGKVVAVHSMETVAMT